MYFALLYWPWPDRVHACAQDAKAREAAFEPEVEEEEEAMPQQNGAAAPASHPGASSAQPATPNIISNGAAEQHAEQHAGSDAAQPVQAAEPEREQSTLHRLAPELPGDAKFGLEVRKKPGDLLSRQELLAQRRKEAAEKLPGAAEKAAAAGGAGGILQDLALLQRAGRPEQDGMESDHAAAEQQPVQEQQQPEGWRPPEGQRGDGRTKLNDLLGY